MARDPRPSTIAERGALQFKISADGSISNLRLERLALMMADEVPVATAWKTLGGNNDGGSFDYRKKVEAEPRFAARVAELIAEREELMTDDLYGEAKWMANQMWREGRAKADTTLMTKAADMRMKILEKEDARRGASEGTRGPGAPVVESGLTNSSMGALRQALIDKGVAVPAAPGGQRLEAVRAPPPEPIILVVAAEPDEAAPDDFMARLDRAFPVAAAG